MIGDAAFEVRAVGGELSGQFAAELPGHEIEYGSPFVGFGKLRRAETQAHEVVQVVVVAGAGRADLQEVEDELHVLDDREQARLAYELRLSRMLLHQPPGVDHVGQADGGHHGARPVDASAIRVATVPIAELVQQFVRVARFGGEQERLAQDRQMKHRRQVPGHFQIRGVVQRVEGTVVDLFALHFFDLAPTPHGIVDVVAPAEAGLEVELPIDVGT